ncbi:MAG: phosphoribosyltransferase, partial [Candidatus Falkowbacteria bacterium]|nr:phosphoribosyltransferase [Candidatus Falkowbacteria bacterium]
MQEADIELSVPVEGAPPQVVLEEILKQKGLDKERFNGRILGVPGAVARGHFVDGEGSHYFEHVRKTMFSQTNATRGFLLVQALAAKLVGSDPGFCKDEKICVVAPEGRSSVYILSLANQLSKFYDPIEDHDELEARDLPFYPVPVEDFIKRDGSIGYRLSKSSAIFCRGARSIIFVDLVNSGYTIHAVAQVLRDAGSTVAMACSFVNQGGQTA